MSPEQAQGRQKEIGPTSDVWSLGAVLYELLTGRPPFTADNALEVLRDVVEAEELEITVRPAPGREDNSYVSYHYWFLQ